MGSHGHTDLPPVPPPSPWVMGIVILGAGVTLWLLTPAAVRRKEESSRAVWGDASPWTRRPSRTRAYYVLAWRAASAFMVVAGLVVLGVAVARA